MNVKNRKCIWKLSWRSLWASRKRNIIAIIAIALTTLLFTSLFTIIMSINSSYENYTFRQVGGYCHGTFKEVTEKQIQKIAAHSNIKEIGKRISTGYIDSGAFAKVPAEVSFMDANCTKWSFAKPTTGHMPQSGKEIAMDTNALKLLGVTGMTMTQVMGCGVQKGAGEMYRGVEMDATLLPKVKVEVVVSKIPVATVIEAAKKALYTGHIGDGKIFVYNVDKVVKVRTGEEDFAALQDVE